MRRACAIAVEVNAAAAKAHNVAPKAVTIQQFKDAVKGVHAKIVVRSVAFAYSSQLRTFVSYGLRVLRWLFTTAGPQSAGGEVRSVVLYARLRPQSAPGR